MALRFCLLVCLTGCGLTLDLDEPMDASLRDASLPDAVAGDAGPFDAGLDVRVTDGGGPDARADVPVMRFDAGTDAPGCGICMEGFHCVDDECLENCRTEEDCDAPEFCDLESGFCLEPECGSSEDCPSGEGCTYPTCDGGRCGVAPIEFNEMCEFCDPRSGEILENDADNDGFPPCVGMCMDDGDECDCNDSDALVNPLTLDILGSAVDAEALCRGVMLPMTVLVCVVDIDGDGAVVIQRAPGGTCEGDWIPARELGEFDCDDDDSQLYPGNDDFRLDPQLDCDPSEACFEYNCDRREEREFPSFADCRGADDEDECADASGWTRAEGIPACGEGGSFRTCRWEPADGCVAGAATRVRQRCR